MPVTHRSLRIAGSVAVAALLLLNPLAATGQDYRDNFPEQYTSSPMGVNLQTGRFSYWLFSFAMGPFVAERGFNRSGFAFPASVYQLSENAPNGGLIDTVYVNMGNPAVSLGNRVELVQNGSRPIKLTYLKGGGSTIGFRASYTGSTFNGYTNIYNPGSEGRYLTKTNGVFILTDKSGTRYEFGSLFQTQGSGSGGRLSSVISADGARIDVTYNLDGRLLYASSNRGYALRYEYLSGGAQIKICGFNLAQTYATASTPCSSSAYTVTINNTVRSDGLLQPVSVVDLMGQTTGLTWGGFEGNFPTCITLPNSTACEVSNTFGPQPGEPIYATMKDQVRLQTDANGNAWTYTYEFAESDSEVPPRLGGPSVASKSILSGPGFGVIADYQAGLVQRITAPGGGPNTFIYSGANLWKATYPESNIMQIDRDWNGNATGVADIPKVGSGLATMSSGQSFPEPILGSIRGNCIAASPRLCDKPIDRTDPAGNKTEFTYAPEHGGVLTKKLPAVQVGGTGAFINPVVRYEYAQRYAWIKTSTNSFAPMAMPIWVLTAERACRATATVGNACAGGAADETVTAYDYGPTSGSPNNLVLRGVAVTADGITLRTCYGYDAQGRKISETQPAAGLAVCP